MTVTKEKFVIEDEESVEEVLALIEEDKEPFTYIGNTIYTEDYEFEIKDNIVSKLQHLLKGYNNPLIYGKDQREKIVNVDIKNNKIVLFYYNGDIEEIENVYWVLSNQKLDTKFKTLKGNNHYKYIRLFRDKKDFGKWTHIWKKKNKDIYLIYDDIESAMVYHGITLFKGLQVSDVSVLSFDLETDGLVHHSESTIFLIANTFRDKTGKVTKKLFRVDEYVNDVGLMIQAWCKWVRKIDPDIVNNHNIYGYDFPYIAHVASLHNVKLKIGKDNSEIKFKQRDSNYRVDGSQTWKYKKCHVFGRQIIDTMFTSVKYDIGRNYPSWKLKEIIEYESLVKEDRQFYDASKIKDDWYDLEKRELICKYAEDDGDDALALFDLQIPSLFYLCQSVPKTLEKVVISASGSWLNLIMVRAYLQEGRSIAKTSDSKRVAGGMSWGNPGIHTNVIKWDAKSYYPSTILKFKLYDKKKDPNAYYYEMVKHFTYRRFDQKAKYKETGNKYFKDLQESSKTFINSAYGLCATTGLNYNNFDIASEITRCCRKGLQKSILWSTGKPIEYWWEDYNEEQDYEDYEHIDKYCIKSLNDVKKLNYKLVNLDTDSLSVCKYDGSPFTEKEYNDYKQILNELMYCVWEDDGSFEKVIIAKAKNYILYDGEKIKKKGSSITDSKKELALQKMIDEIIDCWIYEKDNPVEIYKDYVWEAGNIQDISRWSVKKNITEKLFKSDRTNETKVVDAIKGIDYQIGDKIYLYSAIDGEIQDVAKGEPQFKKYTKKEIKQLKLPVNPITENCEHNDKTFCMICNPQLHYPKMIPNRILKRSELWNGKDHDTNHYIKRVYKTIEIFSNILNMDEFTNYSLVKNEKLLKRLLKDECI